MRVADRLFEERGKAQAFARAADASKALNKEHADTVRMHGHIIRLNPDMRLVWVEPAMMELVQHAQRSLEPFPFHPDLLPWPSAMCVSSTPFFTSDQYEIRDATHCIWGLSDEKNAVCVSFAESYAGYVMPISLAIGAQDRPWKDEPIARITCTLWLMLQQRIAVIDYEEPSRAARRRAERSGDTVDPVIVIRLRRPVTSGSGESGNDVNWSHRWMVDGHWRNQYLPSTGQHRPTWIAPYVKGPDDKPLIVKEKVYVWKR